jgi:Protein of unknown function (DUF2917)
VKNNLAAFPTAIIRALDSRDTVVANPSTTQTEIIRLPRGKIIRLEKNSGVKSLESKSGVIWLTGTPANGDVLLSPGERFELRGNWPFVIQALEPAKLSLNRVS